jgi:hypothetical protein
MKCALRVPGRPNHLALSATLLFFSMPAAASSAKSGISTTVKHGTIEVGRFPSLGAYFEAGFFKEAENAGTTYVLRKNKEAVSPFGMSREAKHIYRTLMLGEPSLPVDVFGIEGVKQIEDTIRTIHGSWFMERFSHLSLKAVKSPEQTIRRNFEALRREFGYQDEVPAFIPTIVEGGIASDSLWVYGHRNNNRDILVHMRLREDFKLTQTIHRPPPGPEGRSLPLEVQRITWGRQIASPLGDPAILKDILIGLKAYLKLFNELEDLRTHQLHILSGVIENRLADDSIVSTAY